MFDFDITTILLDFFSRPEFNNPFTSLWFLFTHGGWFSIGITIVWGLWKMWFHEIKNHYAAHCKYILLAINVPKLTEQTPKAAEHIFEHMEGLFREPATRWEKYWLGENQQNFAVELVSRGGVIQYHCYIEKRFQNIFEAAVFAQYPDAEIREVPDYAQEYPRTWPDEKYEMYAWEMKLIKPYLYPIRTHVSFVDQVTGLLKDPLESLLGFLANLKPGEEVWIQYCLVPTDDSWHTESRALVKKLIGAKDAGRDEHGHGGMLSGITSLFTSLFDAFFAIFHMVFGGQPFEKGHASAAGDSSPPTMMMHMSPGEKAIVEQIQLKASKPGFLGKIRIVYIAPKEVFSKATIFSGVLGAFRQVGGTELNSFKMDKVKTSAYYAFTKWRIARKQNKMWKAFLGRSNKRGGKNYIFNVEELATLWHFPMIESKTPLISKNPSKQAEPPRDLPVEEIKHHKEAHKIHARHDEELPENIPFI